MVELLLIRHGESEWNRQNRAQGISDSRLTPKGRKQAEKLALYLKNFDLSAVYSSSLKRSLETADIIARFHKISVRVFNELSEINLGVWEGKTNETIQKEYGDLLIKWYTQPHRVKIPKGETIFDFRRRIKKVFKKILDDNSRGTIAVITHGGVISIFLINLLGVHLGKIWTLSPRIGSITTVEFYDDGGFYISGYNQVHFLGRYL
jgi:broad specificity phosphatase PhoE